MEKLFKEIMYINTSKLTSKVVFQREVRSARVQKLVKTWNPAKCKPLQVAEVDGKYIVWDGQHTMAAAIMLNGGRDLDMPCFVTKMTYEEAARLVATQYDNEVRLSTYETFVALVENKDPAALSILKAVEDLGLHISGHKSANNITCIATLKRIHNEGFDVLSRVLYIAASSWEGTSDRFRKEVLEGIWKVVHAFGDSFRDADMVAKLRQYSVNYFIAESRSSQSRSPAMNVAEAIIGVYNKGRKQCNRLDVAGLVKSPDSSSAAVESKPTKRGRKTKTTQETEDAASLESELRSHFEINGSTGSGVEPILTYPRQDPARPSKILPTSTQIGIGTGYVAVNNLKSVTVEEAAEVGSGELEEAGRTSRKVSPRRDTFRGFKPLL